MNIRTLARGAFSIIALAVLAACGGGNGDTPPAVGAQSLVSGISAATPQSKRLHTLAMKPNVKAAALPATLTAKEMLDWVEYKIPSLFPKGAQSFTLPYLGIEYTVRAYPSGRYLAVASTGGLYGLGDFSNNELRGYGTIADWAALIRADECGVYPSNCVNQPPSGTLNECVDPNEANLPAGFRLHLVYELTGGGEWISDSEIKGDDTFDGQSAKRTESTTSGTIAIGPLQVGFTEQSSTYQRRGSSGLVETLGTVVEESRAGFSFPGLPPQPDTRLKTKTIYNPVDDNREFTLTLGQSLDKTSTFTTTILESSTGTPPVGTVTPTSLTRTFTYEAKESISVPAGTFLTCRYKEVSQGQATTTWYIVGKGIPARSEEMVDGQLQATTLKSGTYNGSPL